MYWISGGFVETWHSYNPSSLLFVNWICSFQLFGFSWMICKEMIMVMMMLMMMMMTPVSQASDGQRVLEEPQRSLGLLHHWS